MLALLLAVACSLSIAMIFKYAGRRGLDRVGLLTANYAAAAFLAALLLVTGAKAAGSGGAPGAPLLALGMGTGALFIAGFFVFALATEVAGMSLAVGVMRVAVVVPFLASWAIWDEVPSLAQGAGLALAGGAFFMIARKKNPGPVSEPAAVPEPAEGGAVEADPTRRAGAGEGARPAPGRRAFAVLALLFLSSGAVDVCMKTFDEVFAASNGRPLFLLLAFGGAFLIGLGVVSARGVRRGRWPGAAVLSWGVLLGLVNYGSVEFFLRAIRQLSGPFVFPANSISIVLGAALLGVYVWGERLSALNKAGLGCAALALLLLNL